MITNKPKINRNFKDRLFRMVFQKKEDLLDLYNAINGTSYSDPDELEINTLEDVIYMGMRNDVSFFIDCFLNLYEHQSTLNPNLPVRGLLYFADLYRNYIALKKLNLYSSVLKRLPFPRFVVFYNGTSRQPDRQELKLSDAFFDVESDEPPALEVRVTMLNINWGHNRELMEKCRRLSEYAQFIACVRDYLAKDLTPEAAIEQAVADCIQSGILAQFLTGHRAEVMDVILTEYNEQEHMEMERNEWEARGILHKLTDLVCKKLCKGLSSSEIAEILEEDPQTIETICTAANHFAPEYDSNKIVDSILAEKNE